jgi:hypothetical protein
LSGIEQKRARMVKQPAMHAQRTNVNDGFTALELRLCRFGYNAGGWRPARHLRMLADVTGNGLSDSVGSGAKGVLVAENHPQP